MLVSFDVGLHVFISIASLWRSIGDGKVRCSCIAATDE